MIPPRSQLVRLCFRALFVLTVGPSAALLPGSVRPASAEIIDRIVARINDDIVTYQQVKEAAIPYLLQNGMLPQVPADPQARHDLYRKVLDDQVDRYLLNQQASEMGVEVTKDEVDRWLANTRAQQNLDEAQFRQMIASYGMEYETYRTMIRENLLRMRVVNLRLGSKVSVSDEEVNRAYRERYGSNSGRLKVAEVSNILVVPADNTPAALKAARDKAMAARQAIQDGTDFADVARQYSDGPAAATGGYLGRFSEGQLEPSIEKIVFSLGAGEVSAVTQTPFGFQIIKVQAVSSQVAEDVEERRAELRAELQQQAINRQLQAYLQKLRAQAFVETSL